MFYRCLSLSSHATKSSRDSLPATQASRFSLAAVRRNIRYIFIPYKDENQLRRDLKLWLDKIEQHYKVKPILYTSYKFKTRYLNDSVFNSYPYWIAHYYVDSVEYRGEWKFWQHTDVGTLPGIREKVDLNIFNGSLEELQLMTIKK